MDAVVFTCFAAWQGVFESVPFGGTFCKHDSGTALLEFIIMRDYTFCTLTGEWDWGVFDNDR